MKSDPVSYASVEGIDYIMDCFAVLGLSYDLPDGESFRDVVRQAFKSLSVGCHPDKLLHLDESLRREGHAKFLVLLQARDTLLKDGSDAHRRALAAFPDFLRSKDGTPIHYEKPGSLLMSRLVSGQKEDLAFLEEEAKKLSGYDEKTLVAARKLLALEDTAETRDGLLAQLSKKNAYLALLESLAWQRSGVSGRDFSDKIASPDSYEDEVVREIEATVERVHGEVKRRLMALPAGKVLALRGKDDGSEDPRDSAEELARSAADFFYGERKRLLEIAGERAKIQDEMVSFTRWEYLSEVRARNTVAIFSSEGEDKASFYCREKDGQVKISILRGEDDISEDEIRASSLIRIHSSKDLSFVAELQWVIERHLEGLDEKNTPSSEGGKRETLWNTLLRFFSKPWSRHGS